MQHFLKYWFPPLALMALIFVISTDLGSASHTGSMLEPFLRWLKPGITAAEMEHIHFLVRKGGHLTGYALLAILWWRAFTHRQNAHPSAWPLASAGWALLASAAYAATDEFHQTFVPSRTPSVHDVMIDSCGALVGLALALSFRVLLRRKAEV